MDYLRGKNEEEREKTIESLGEAEAKQVREMLVKIDRVVADTIDLTKEPTIEMVKEMQQIMKEVSSQRHLKKLGEKSGAIEPLEWRAFIIKIVAMFYTLKACFSITVDGNMICAHWRETVGTNCKAQRKSSGRSILIHLLHFTKES